jgi:hypothetical protein
MDPPMAFPSRTRRLGKAYFNFGCTTFYYICEPVIDISFLGQED